MVYEPHYSHQESSLTPMAYSSLFQFHLPTLVFLLLFTPLHFLTLSHQLWHIKQDESLWSPKRFQILTDYQAVHSLPTSPFFCNFFPPLLLWSIQMSAVDSVSGLMMYDKFCIHFVTFHYCICIPQKAVCIHAGSKEKRCKIRYR